jgi:GTP-binding protein Era
MNVRMVDAAIETIREVDVLGLVIDASEKAGHGTRFLLDLLSAATVPVVLILNKVDLVARLKLLPMLDQWQRQQEFADIVPVSALSGDNVDELERVFLKHLPEGEPLYPADFLTDQPERALVAELVREQVLRHTRAELPFSTAVLIDRIEEPDQGGLLRLYCTILVERESQKPILIGRGGEMVKRIGTAARQELERFFHARVFLDLRIKVQADWRDDDSLLDRLGVRPPES